MTKTHIVVSITIYGHFGTLQNNFRAVCTNWDLISMQKRKNFSRLASAWDCPRVSGYFCTLQRTFNNIIPAHYWVLPYMSTVSKYVDICQLLNQNAVTTFSYYCLQRSFAVWVFTVYFGVSLFIQYLEN